MRVAVAATSGHRPRASQLPLSPLPTGRRKFVQLRQWLIARSCFFGHLRLGLEPIVRIPIIFPANVLRGLFMYLNFTDSWRQMHPFLYPARKGSFALESGAPISQPSQGALAILVDGSHASEVDVQRAWRAYRRSQVFGG